MEGQVLELISWFPIFQSHSFWMHNQRQTYWTQYQSPWLKCKIHWRLISFSSFSFRCVLPNLLVWWNRLFWGQKLNLIFHFSNWCQKKCHSILTRLHTQWIYQGKDRFEIRMRWNFYPENFPRNKEWACKFSLLLLGFFKL